MSHEQPRVLDLFCGAGGFSEGFRQAGYNIVCAIDYNETALETHALNHPDTTHIHADLSEASPGALLEDHGVNPDEIDVVIGGPPCQGFSIAGNHDDDDPRNQLVYNYFDWLEFIEPVAFVMENVPRIVSHNDGETIDALLELGDSLGYTMDYRVLNSADYGVPQTRKRCIVQGVRGADVVWPEQTHFPPDE